MTQDTIRSLCVAPTVSMKGAIQRINETARKMLFVVDDQERIIGTISDGDIRRGLLAGYGFNESVEKIMFRDFIALSAQDPNAHAQAREVMLERNVPILPLIDAVGHICDIIQWIDILGSSKAQGVRELHDNEIVVMAGGKGTRLDVFTKIFPKPLIPVGDKPAIEFIMERFYKYGFHKFLFTLNYKKEYIKLFLKEKEFPYDYAIDFVEEQEFLGTAGSISLLNHRLEDTFFVVNCDTILDVDYTEVLAWHKEHGASLTVIGCHNEIDIPFGVLQLAGGKLARIDEKPSHDIIMNTGMYVMEPSIFTYLTAGSVMDMNDLINLVAQKENVSVYPVYGRDWLDLGQWDAYKRSTKILEDNGDV